MKNADLLISGGGTLIQDGTSTKSLIYYLSVIKMALSHNVKVMLYSNGVGPLKRTFNKKLTRRLLNKVNLITLRDEDSAEILRKIGVTEPKTIVTADPVFGLDCAEEELGRKILSSAGVPERKKVVGVSVRKWPDSCRGFENAVAEACDYLSEKYGFYTVFVPMQLEKDLAISENIMRKMKSKASIIDKRCSVEEMTSVFKCLDLCIGMRLHSLIYSAAEGIPLIGLAYDPKIISFMEYTHQSLFTDVQRVDGKKLIALAEKCISDYDEERRDLQSRCAYLKEQAERNGALAIELYERIS